MAEIWGAAIAAGGAILGGVMSSKGAKDAAATSAAGSDAAIAEQRRQFNLMRQDTAPYRTIGAQALNALGGIYGYRPAAQPLSFEQWSAQNPAAVANPKGGKGGNALEGALVGGALGDPITGAIVGNSGGDIKKILDPAGLFGGGKKKPKPTVDPRQSQYQAYLEGFDYSGGSSAPKTPPGNSFAPGGRAGYDSMSGYQIGPGGSISRGIGGGGAVIDNESGQVLNDTAVGSAMPAGPDYSAFFASPDYQFRRDEGTRGLSRAYAAQGLGKSGNALAALAEYNSGLAAGEFGNYFNRQAALAGIGQSAVNTSVGAGASSAANIGNALIGGANSRASGIADSANAWGNALGTIGGIAYDRWGRPNRSQKGN